MRDWGVNHIKIEDEQASIRVALEGEELRRRAKLAHENRVKAQALDEERKRVVQGYKTRIEQAQASADEYQRQVADEYYTELAMCPARLVRSTEARHGWMVEILHPTTAAVVSTRDPSPAELSMAREPALPLAAPAGEDDGDDEGEG